MTGSVTVQTKIQLRIFGKSWKLMFTYLLLLVWLNRRTFARKSRQIFPFLAVYKNAQRTSDCSSSKNWFCRYWVHRRAMLFRLVFLKLFENHASFAFHYTLHFIHPSHTIPVKRIKVLACNMTKRDTGREAWTGSSSSWLRVRLIPEWAQNE